VPGAIAIAWQVATEPDIDARGELEPAERNSLSG